MALVRKGRMWYVYFRDLDGRLTSQSLRVTDREDAERLHTLFMRELRARRGAAALFRRFPDLSPKPETEPSADEQKREHRRGGLKVADVVSELEKIAPLEPSKRRIVARFARECPVTYCDQITPELALRYLESNFSGGRNFKAFNNNLTALNAAFKKVLIPARIAESPFSRIACRRVGNVVSYRPLTDAEAAAVISSCEGAYRTAAMLGFFAGMDLSTAISCPCRAVRFDTGIIRWRRVKTGAWFTAGIHPQLRDHLAALDLPESDLPVVQHVAGKVQKENAFEKYFRRVFDRLGIADGEEGAASFHSFRASFFTRCDAAGLHRRTTSLAGGHKDDRMNDLYSHDVSAAREVERLPSLALDVSQFVIQCENAR